jgi:hypothetical protein
VVCVCVAAGVALAATQTAFTQSFRASGKAVTAPGRSTGFLFRSHAGDPDNTPGNAQPARLEKITDTLPSGTAVDQDAAPRCGASDEDFRQRGVSACPKRTRIGAGSAALRRPTIGSPDEAAAITAFDGRANTLILYVQPTTDTPAFVLRPTVEGTHGKSQAIVTRFPVICKFGLFSGGQPVCGFGGEERRISAFDLRVAAIATGKGKKRRLLVRTPRTCPKPSRRWTFRARFDYADGSSSTIPYAVSCTT